MHDMDLMIADMEKELIEKQIIPGLCFRKGYDESLPGSAGELDEILSEKDKKKQGSILSERNSVDTKHNDSVLSDQKSKNRKAEKKEEE
jgi:hypothetical protein